MRLFGLHIIDVLIVLAYLVGMLYIGFRVSAGIKSEADIYLGGRKFGKLLQFFLNFGNMTDATGAATVSTEVYRQGIAGMWIGFQTLLLTPFYWFANVWYRRTRLITMADLFVDRFDSRGLAATYAAFNVLLATLLIGVGYLAAYKVNSAMLVKPPAVYSAEERIMVDNYAEYRQLQPDYLAGNLGEMKQDRYRELDSLYKQGRLHSYVSYLSPGVFYLAYGTVVGIYVIMGGLCAAAITDAVQGVLLILFSVMLVPLGLLRIGGVEELHRLVPERYFEIFGSVTMSDYAWYTILAIAFTSLIQIFGLFANIAVSGSAKTEFAARLGAVTGGFSKRLMIIAWAFCGLIAVAMFGTHGVSDPDNTWGLLSSSLLFPGAMGLMISGMLAANMSSLDAGSISIAALFVRNLYRPLFPERSEAHYVLAGRIVMGIVLLLGGLVALSVSGVIALLTSLITLGSLFGAAVLLIFFWRRLTAQAIYVAVVIWVIVMGAFPVAAPHFVSIRQSPGLLAQTRGIVRSDQENENGEQHVIPGRAVYFDAVVRSRPSDASSPLEGVGRFHVEAYLISLIGVPVERFSAAGLVATRWAFAGVFPFVLMIVVSYLTPRTRRDLLDRFYVKMKTPSRRRRNLMK